MSTLTMVPDALPMGTSPLTAVQGFLKVSIDLEDPVQASEFEHGVDARLKARQHETPRTEAGVLITG
jgi:hypothetical protein